MNIVCQRLTGCHGSDLEVMTVVETIVEQLQDRILAGQFPPGSRLPSERELSAQLQVARAPVREALSRLEQMRLISVRHGPGSTVTDFTAEAGPESLARLLQLAMLSEGGLTEPVVRGLIEARIHLGGVVAELAARRADSTTREALAHMAAQDLQLLEHADLVERDFAFFETLVRASGNLVFQLFYNSIRAPYLANRDLLGILIPVAEHVQSGHRAIVDAVMAGDAVGAAAAARNYLSRGSAPFLPEVNS